MEAHRPVQQCPHCKLPLTRDESREPLCPVCGEPLYDAEPISDDLLDVHSFDDDIAEDTSPDESPAEAVDDRQGPAETMSRIGLAVAIALMLLMLTAGIVLTSVFSGGQDDRDPPLARKNRPAAVMLEPLSATRPGDKDSPGKQADPAIQGEDPKDIPDPVAEVPPDQDLGPERNANVAIKAPHGKHTVAAVTANNSFKLSGTVKKLVIGGVHGQGVLTTEKLTAEEVVVTGSVNGSGALKLNVPGGSVKFLSPLDGAARVRINAPGGKVTFGPVDKSRYGGGIIVGSANVSIVARDVDLRGVVDGGSRVLVTLTEGGSLRFSMIAGGARVQYRKAKPEDPEPRIDRGRVIAGGKFLQVDPPQQPKAPAKAPPGPSPKIEFDLTKLDKNGLRGPAGGKVLVAYEFCIPNTAKCKAEVRAIDPAIRLMPGSRGRIGAGKDECLCIGETGANYRTVLNRLAALSYVKRIIECHWE